MNIVDTIYVRKDFLHLVKLLEGYKSIYCIYDRNVEHYVREINELIDFRALYAIHADEYNKVFDTVIDICRFLLSNGANRDALVVTIGGGLTSDIGGFAASIYKRGIKFAYVPTTLLSQVDAAIGGKTGINLDAYKNIIGTIIQPIFTYINVNTLSSLPHREFLSGAAEMLKTFIIDGAENYQKAIDYLSSPEKNYEIFLDLIKSAALIKAHIVSRDEFENGERRKLNLGHTFAHAIEWYEHDKNISNPHTHGEAVSIGIIKALEISSHIGECSKELVQKVKVDFNKCGLPVELPYKNSDLTAAMIRDKKSINGGVNFIIVNSIGSVNSHFFRYNELCQFAKMSESK